MTTKDFFLPVPVRAANSMELIMAALFGKVGYNIRRSGIAYG